MCNFCWLNDICGVFGHFETSLIMKFELQFSGGDGGDRKGRSGETAAAREEWRGKKRRVRSENKERVLRSE